MIDKWGFLERASEEINLGGLPDKKSIADENFALLRPIFCNLYCHCGGRRRGGGRICTLFLLLSVFLRNDSRNCTEATFGLNQQDILAFEAKLRF